DRGVDADAEDRRAEVGRERPVARIAAPFRETERREAADDRQDPHADDERESGLEPEVEHAVLPVLRRDLPDRLVLEDHPVEEDEGACEQDDRGEVVAAAPAGAERAAARTGYRESGERDQ